MNASLRKGRLIHLSLLIKGDWNVWKCNHVTGTEVYPKQLVAAWGFREILHTWEGGQSALVALRLKASDGRVFLIAGTDCYKGRWYCNVFLETERDVVRLGEEGFEHIRSQMLPSLRPPYETREGVFCDKKVDFFWILNLMGPHAAIYGVPAEKNAGENDPNLMREIDLYCMTADGEKHFIMKLSPEDIQSWLTILEDNEQLPEDDADVA